MYVKNILNHLISGKKYDGSKLDQEKLIHYKLSLVKIMDQNKTYGHLGKEKIDIKENDTFIKFCGQLGLPYITYNLCNEVYTSNIEKLESVAPKSITAGVLFYVVKFKLGLKQPSKSRISQIVNVCIPTINKVINILEN